MKKILSFSFLFVFLFSIESFAQVKKNLSLEDEFVQIKPSKDVLAVGTDASSGLTTFVDYVEDHPTLQVHLVAIMGEGTDLIDVTKSLCTVRQRADFFATFAEHRLGSVAGFQQNIGVREKELKRMRTNGFSWHPDRVTQKIDLRFDTGRFAKVLSGQYQVIPQESQEDGNANITGFRFERYNKDKELVAVFMLNVTDINIPPSE